MSSSVLKIWVLFSLKIYDPRRVVFYINIFFDDIEIIGEVAKSYQIIAVSKEAAVFFIKGACPEIVSAEGIDVI